LKKLLAFNLNYIQQPNCEMKDKKTTYKKPEHSKMPFDEVMERIVRVKKSEVEQQIKEDKKTQD